MRRMRHLKPREIQGCDIAFQFWRPETLYDATSGGNLVASGGAIARIEDVSGNGNHATSSLDTDRPARIVAAQNGLDAGRFDGTSDRLNAGDVADMLDKPVECYAVFIRTGAAGVRGIFGKSRAAVGTGRWSLIQGATTSDDNFLFAGSTPGSVNARLATSTSLQLLYGHSPRGNTTVNLSRNAGSPDSLALTDTGASQNTTDHLVIGAYQNASGTQAPPLTNSLIAADILECVKWSVSLTDQTRKRAQHAAMRRARIAG